MMHNPDKANLIATALRYSGLRRRYNKIIFISSKMLKNITYAKVASASKSALRIGVHAVFLVGCVLLVV